MQGLYLYGVIEQLGTVFKSTGSWYRIQTDTGEWVEARLKGKFRIKGIKATNPVAVGDRVKLHTDKDGNLLISHIENRKNYLIRKSTNLSKQVHILAANIDQVVLIATVKKPFTTKEFIDRISITAEAYNIPFTLILNKSDLIQTENEEALFQDYLHTYRSIGIEVIKNSLKKDVELTPVKELLRNKTSLVSGMSGVGKSSLINAIDPSLTLKVGDVSNSHKTGKHTTTFAEMHELSIGGNIIDTPGLRAFGVIDFEKENLSHYFVEMQQFFNTCKFHNCLHLKEPGCKVRVAVEEGNIPKSRYQTYLNIMQESNSIHRENKYL